MNLVDDIYLVTAVYWWVLHLFADVTSVVYTIVGCGVHFGDVDVVCALVAHKAISARVAVVTLRIGAVYSACKNLCGGRFARSASACKQVSMGHLVVQNLVAQRGNDVPRPIRKRFDDELIDIMEKLKWWDKSIEEINSLIPLLTSSDLEKVKEELSKLV